MFKLLAADQKEYGPVSADQIRQWIAQGRANGQTRAQAADSTDWKPLAEIPEFAEALRLAATPPGQPPAPAPGTPPPPPPKTSGLAITSLVLGCLGLVSCGVTSLVGLILGIIALVRINKSKGQLGGQGIALAGTIVSAAFLLLVPIPAAMLLPALAKAKQKASAISCMNNIKQLNLGLLMYANDNKDLFPTGTNWCDLIMPYVKNSQTFLCPLGPPGQRCDYAFNANLVGRESKDIRAPAQTVMIFETDGGWDVAGGRERLPAKPRHSGAYAVGFADGHVEMVRADRLGRLGWEP
jgi:prepilin-type processing-associated H-X9-DG protein